MFNKKLLFSLFCLLFSSILCGQEPPSLGDIARKARAEKQKNTMAKAPSPADDSTPATADGETAATPAAKTGEQKPEQSPAPTAGGTQAGVRPGIPIKGELGFIESNQAGIRMLFEQEDFKAIDRVADDVRAAEARFPGGFWQIHLIYEPLAEPKRGANAGEAEWKLHLDRLKKWIAQSPNSVTARIALAEAYRAYGWKARGSGYADSVTEDGWQLLQERQELSAKALAEAFKLPVKCPEWFLAMQLLLSDMGASKEMQAAAFEKAVAFEPDYQYYYRVAASSLQAKWGGSDEEVVAFTEKAADRVGGKKGDMMYYQVAHVLNCNCGDDDKLHGLSWTRIKRGYMALEEMYGVSLVNLNKVAYMAAIGGDPEYAHETFARIGNEWELSTWKTKDQFENTKSWAEGAAEAKAIERAMSAAAENAKTSEGQRFDSEIGKAFDARYGKAFGDCVKQSDPTFRVPFNLAVRLGKEGNVEQIYTSITYEISACLTPQVQKGKFPAPPRPSYWIKIKLQPSSGEVGRR